MPADVLWLAAACPPELDAARSILARDGLRLELCADLAALRAAARKGGAPELILADLDDWPGDPRRLVRLIRADARLRRSALMFLAGRSGDGVAQALRDGADDFLIKPVPAELLCARIEAAVQTARRLATPEPWSRRVLRARDGRVILELRERRCQVQRGVDYEEVVLTRRQFEVLAALLKRPNRTVGWRELYARGWRPSRLRRRSRTLVQHVMSLRRKLGALAERLEVVPGLGYRWRE
ncbi:MAG: response regulator transcription factor [Elusimicrobia bacterium]|nr:response regulator transcription factor [Elusimicrobiota bacterium]